MTMATATKRPSEIPNAATSISKNPNAVLYAAVRERNLAKITEAVQAGANINIKDEKGKTAIILLTEDLAKLAVHDGGFQTDYLELIPALVKLGANINETNSGGNTAVNNLVKFSTDDPLVVRIIETLLQNGANPNLGDIGSPPLFTAAIEGKVNTVKLLANRGADLEIKDPLGRSAVQGVAVALNNAYYLEINGFSEETRTHYAEVLKNYEEILRFLVRKKADISAIDETIMQSRVGKIITEQKEQK